MSRIDLWCMKDRYLSMMWVLDNRSHLHNTQNILVCINMVPTDHDIPFSRTFQGLLRYIFKEFSRTFLCSSKHPFAKK